MKKKRSYPEIHTGEYAITAVLQDSSDSNRRPAPSGEVCIFSPRPSSTAEERPTKKPTGDKFDRRYEFRGKVPDENVFEIENFDKTFQGKRLYNLAFLLDPRLEISSKTLADIHRYSSKSHNRIKKGWVYRCKEVPPKHVKTVRYKYDHRKNIQREEVPPSRLVKLIEYKSEGPIDCKIDGDLNAAALLEAKRSEICEKCDTRRVGMSFDPSRNDEDEYKDTCLHHCDKGYKPPSRRDLAIHFHQIVPVQKVKRVYCPECGRKAQFASRMPGEYVGVRLPGHFEHWETNVYFCPECLLFEFKKTPVHLNLGHRKGSDETYGWRGYYNKDGECYTEREWAYLCNWKSIQRKFVHEIEYQATLLPDHTHKHCKHILTPPVNHCPICDGWPLLPEEDSVHEGREVDCPVMGKRTKCRKHNRFMKRRWSNDLGIYLSACSICTSDEKVFEGYSEELGEELGKKEPDAVKDLGNGLQPDPDAREDFGSNSELAERLIAEPDPDELDKIYEKPKADAESKIGVDDPETVEKDERLSREERKEAQLEESYRRVYPWEMTGVQCRAVYKDGKRCERAVYGDEDNKFCFYHHKLMTNTRDRKVPWVKKILDNRDSKWVRKYKVLIEGEKSPRLPLPDHKGYRPIEVDESDTKRHQIPEWINEVVERQIGSPNDGIVHELAKEFPLYEGGKYQPIISLGFEEACRRVAHERKIEWDDSVDKEFRAFLEFVWTDLRLEFAFGYTFLYRPPVFGLVLPEETRVAFQFLLGPLRVDFGFFVTIFERHFEAVCLAHMKREAGDARDFEIVLEESLPTIIKRENTTYEVWGKPPSAYDYVYQRTIHEDHEEITEHYFGMDEATAKKWVDDDMHIQMVSAYAETGYEEIISSKHRHHFCPHAGALPKTEEDLIRACRDASRAQGYSLIGDEKYRRLIKAEIGRLGENIKKDYQYHTSKGKSLLSDQFWRLGSPRYREAAVKQIFENAFKRAARKGMRDSYRAFPARLKKDMLGQRMDWMRDTRDAAYPRWMHEIPDKNYNNLHPTIKDIVTSDEWASMDKAQRHKLIKKWHSPVSLSAPADKDAEEPRPFEEVLAAEPEDAGPLLWMEYAALISRDHLNQTISLILTEEFPEPPKRIVAENFLLFREQGGARKILAILRDQGFARSDSWMSQRKSEIFKVLENREREINDAMWEDLTEQTRGEKLFNLEVRGGVDFDCEGKPTHLIGAQQLIYRKPQKKWDEERPEPEPLRTLTLIDDLTSKYLAKPWTEWIEEWKRSQILPTLTPALLGPLSSVDLTFQQYPYLLVLIGYEYISDARVFSYPGNEWCEEHSTPQKHCLRCETATPETWKVFRTLFTNHHIEILPRAMRCLDRIRSELEWGEKGFCSNPYLNRVKKSRGNLKILNSSPPYLYEEGD